jgi:cobalt-precorrin-5B (C1)-methyltransferase
VVPFPVERCEVGPSRAEAVVVKDAGDDPDVTHGAHLTATVRWSTRPVSTSRAGVGVGVVTKPGLGLEVGGPAINPVPRQMIRDNVGAVVDLAVRGVDVTISVPDGELRARKTTNARLGILGGISILGTTVSSGRSRPSPWRASVVQAVSVMAGAGRADARAGHRRPHRAGRAAHAPELPEVCFVEVGDFTGAALRQAADDGLRDVVFVGMAGKLTKLASGVLMTHYTKSRVDTSVLVAITRELGTREVGAVDLAGRGRGGQHRPARVRAVGGRRRPAAGRRPAVRPGGGGPRPLRRPAGPRGRWSTRPAPRSSPRPSRPG